MRTRIPLALVAVKWPSMRRDTDLLEFRSVSNERRVVERERGRLNGARGRRNIDLGADLVVVTENEWQGTILTLAAETHNAEDAKCISDVAEGSQRPSEDVNPI
jgi:hypothetical protein